VEKFIKEAERFADEDKKNKSKIEAKNEGDTVLYSTEKALREHGGKISQDERGAIDRALAELKEALKSEDVDRITKAKDETMRAAQKLGEVIYKEAGAQAGAAGGPQPGPDAGGHASGNGKENGGKKEDVVDAEVVEEEKKD
jgi:molecular chaperone DnaK